MVTIIIQPPSPDRFRLRLSEQQCLQLAAILQKQMLTVLEFVYL